MSNFSIIKFLIFKNKMISGYNYIYTVTNYEMLVNFYFGFLLKFFVQFIFFFHEFFNMTKIQYNLTDIYDTKQLPFGFFEPIIRQNKVPGDVFYNAGKREFIVAYIYFIYCIHSLIPCEHTFFL